MPDAGHPVTETMHGTCVAIDDCAALIIGPSGAGKSDLALRCLTTPLQHDGVPLAMALVADDQVTVSRDGETLTVRAPAAIAGLLEVRGLGIMRMPVRASALLRLVVDVTQGQPIERLPDPPETRRILGVDVPQIRLVAGEPSAPAKVMLGLVGVKAVR